jgi:hypothetical protein
MFAIAYLAFPPAPVLLDFLNKTIERSPDSSSLTIPSQTYDPAATHVRLRCAFPKI